MIPDDFYREGFVHAHGFADATAAQSHVESFLAALDTTRLPMQHLFRGRVRLTRIARIPHRSCDDAVETTFLALHFEMGLPVVPVDEKTAVPLFVCLYFPHDAPPSETRTRLLRLPRFPEGSPAELEERLVGYASLRGDGWAEHNSGRLSCLGRFADAFTGGAELDYMRDYRIAEWFNADEKRAWRDGRDAETRFFAERGIDVPSTERLVHLQPGDLLIVDNTRVAHGRSGKRGAESLYQFLYGVDDATALELAVMRAHLVACSKG